MKKILCLIGCLIFMDLFSQTSSMVPNSLNSSSGKTSDYLKSIKVGIDWIKGLSWNDIKIKARQENKYIFIDAYATWCGPCKTMDEQVYVNPSVSDYFNQHFLSVKVQMDKTKNDGEEVRRWYSDVDSIKKVYHIREFPTLIFLSPHGAIVEQQSGFKTSVQLISIAENAKSPERRYNDPYQEYDNLLKAYRKGDINYDKYPFMISIATRLNDTIVRKLKRELIQYMLTLKPKERYTKERLEVYRGGIYASTGSIYSFYYHDGFLIDSVIGEPGYSQKRIDETIQAEIVRPFYAEQNKNPNIKMSGMYLGGGVSVPADTSEADWNKLEMLIGKKYNGNYIERNVIAARLEWYVRHRNTEQYLKYGLIKLKKYPPNPMVVRECIQTNSLCWTAFLKSTNKKELKGYCKHIGKIVKFYEKDPRTTWIDTYANLLYKIGKKEKAILWEQKAAIISAKYLQVVGQMKRDEPTYMQRGAIWEK